MEHPALSSMAAQFDRHTPTSFRTDFEVHDVSALASRAHQDPFGWILYDCGTHMFHPAARKPFVEMLRAGDFGTRARAFVWTGSSFEMAADADDFGERLRATIP